LAAAIGVITTKLLRVLLVEDSAEDAVLIEHQIRRGGFELELTRVVTSDDFRERLRAESWDLVISDHDLPGSDSGATLLALKEAKLDIPFLLVSGKIGEEAAVAAMKAGANDYVSKDRLGRLVPVIERELTVAAERRAARVVESELTAALAESLADAKSKARQFEVLHRLAVAASGVLDVARLADMAVEGALELVGADGALLRWYDPVKGILTQLSLRDDRGWVRTDDLVPEQSILGEAFLRRTPIVTNDYQGYDHALESHRREGVTAMVAVPLLIGDRAVGALGVVGYGSRKFSQADVNILSFLGADVAAAIEAARMSTDLERSEGRYRDLYLSSPTGLAVGNVDGTLIDVNPAFCQLVGYTAAELLEVGILALTHPDDVAMSLELLTRMVAGEDRPEPITKRYLRKDGTTIWVILSIAAVRDEEGRVVRMVSQIQDISERKRAEDDLADSLSLLERSQEVGNIGTFVAWLTPEKAGRDEWSPMGIKIFGYTADTFTGNNEDFWSRVHPDDIDRIRKSQSDAHDAGSIYDERHRIIRPDGEVRWLHERAMVERDASGAPTRFLGVTQDITEQHLAEEALRESEDRFRGAFSSSGVGMALSTPDGKFVQVNGAICAMLGRSEAELVGSSLRDFVVEEDIDSERSAILQLLRGDRGYHISVQRHRHAKGHIIWGRVHLSVIRNADRSARYVLAQVEDISAEIAGQAALHAAEARNAAVINATLDGLIVIDGASIVTEFNPAAERMFGLARELVVGRDLAETLMPKRFRAAHRKGIRKNLRAGAPGLSRRVEMIGRRGDGSEFPIEFALSRLETAGAPFFSASVRDLTDRDRLVESVRQLAQVVATAPILLFAIDRVGFVTLSEGRGLEAFGLKPGEAVGSNVFETTKDPVTLDHLRRALAGESFAGPLYVAAFDVWLETYYEPTWNEAHEVVGMWGMMIDVSDRVRGEAARQESDAKSRLVAIVNHEVRTPLNSILGFTELLKAERVGPLNDKQMRYVTNVEMAGRHLLALVNDSLDLSKMAAGKMDLEIFDVDVAEIIDQAAGQVLPLVEARGLEIRVDAGGRLSVRADRRRLLQIIWNLLSNAIRHTATGGTITIRGVMNGPGVDIVITDTGVGIDADQFERIFEEYVQVGVGPDGTGLGLPVSRRLAQLMGGDIHVVSKVGAGSSFTITLPAVQSKDEVQPMIEPAAAPPVVAEPRLHRVRPS
jgi:PAS domain S-box-containing protein